MLKLLAIISTLWRFTSVSLKYFKVVWWTSEYLFTERNTSGRDVRVVIIVIQWSGENDLVRMI